MSPLAWCPPAPCATARASERPRVMTADVHQDRRVTVPTRGSTYPAFVDGSRLYWALPSRVHEGFWFWASSPTGYKVMRCFSACFITAQSRTTTSRRSFCRDPSLRPRNSRALLAAVKAWPGSATACSHARATASLDCSCAWRTDALAGRDEETPRVEQRNWLKEGPLMHPP
jgi:hypothetical protein